jgi:uncharacterized membrane protein
MSEKRFPWRTLLFASVALNLLVLGAAAGAYGAGVRVERQAPEAAIARMPGARAFLAALPVGTRQKMRAELAVSWTQSRELRRVAARARAEAFEAASQEPYDVERVRAAFARLRAADQAAIGVFHNSVVEAFARLTPEERRTALEALRSARPATRRTVTPTAEEAPPDGGAPALDETRQERRERIRERWRERQEGLRERAP